jgi:hypothetical protein
MKDVYEILAEYSEGNRDFDETIALLRASLSTTEYKIWDQKVFSSPGHDVEVIAVSWITEAGYLVQEVAVRDYI